MDASLRSRAEQLASEFASQARTAEDLNGLMRLMMKSALERMLNTEMDVHLGRKRWPVRRAAEQPPEETPGSSRTRGAAGQSRPSVRPTVATDIRAKTVQGDLGE